MKYFYILITLFSFSLYAQTGTEKTLRIMTTEKNVFPLKVINLTTKEETSTDSGGFFKMTVNIGDELVLKENAFYQLSYKISSDHLSQSIVRIYPEPINTVLQEVKVETISSKSLGIDAAVINKYIYKRNPNANMDFKAMFMWVLSKLKKSNDDDFIERQPTDRNTYVASLPRSVITDYLKIPDDLVDKFYYYLYDDYVVDEYIKNGEEEKWKFHLLDKSYKFLEEEGRLPAR